MPVFAYVIAPEAACEFLGPKSIVSWVVQAAEIARGVEKVVCLSANAEAAQRALPRDIPVLSIEPGSESALDFPAVNALLTGAGYNVQGLVELAAGAAFLQTATVEQAVAGVLNEDFDLAVTVWHKPDGQAYYREGIRESGDLDLEFGHCRAISGARLRGEGRKTPRIKRVPIAPLESLDALTDPLSTMAKALVEGGHA